MKLQIYMKEPSVATLGPGNRFCIWVSGCNRKCPGCIAQHAQDKTSGESIETGALAWEIIAANPDGITISGGEPFLQAEALAELIKKVKARLDIGVIVYTGYLISELKSDSAKTLLDEVDLLIDGPYIESFDDGKGLRGSSNQRILPLTDRYINDLHLYGCAGRKTEAFDHGLYKHYVGIPTDSQYPDE